MITDLIINIFVGVVYLIFQAVSLPVVNNIVVPDDAFDALKKILTNVGYILPVETFIYILSFKVAIFSFVVAWAMILRIKSFIPSMGR